ncbi:MAG TPA: dihydroxy-acid dehydratase, partial [Polymorphobacter sp.]|nr:dihydroxy-acid dehydratase [Polymorphobacter sp.]
MVVLADTDTVANRKDRHMAAASTPPIPEPEPDPAPDAPVQDPEPGAPPGSRIDDPALDVTAQDILVLRNAGPKGAPGMPEAGYLPIPKKLLRQGVKDMV